MIRPALTAAGLGLLLATTACGSGAATPGASGATAEKMRVVTSFYPLQFMAERVGGDHVSVTNLTKPGVEPHDLELTPRDIAEVSSAQFAVYAAGFQPAVDAALTQEGTATAYDVNTDADLSLDEAEYAHEPGEGQDHAHAHAKSRDPHFWLDPVRYGKVATALARQLGEVDPGYKGDYQRNAEAFVAELTTLDKEFAAGLTSCASRDLVTSHAAFGYLAQRYDLIQEPVSGLSPETEPDARRLAGLAAYVKEHKVTTLYTETLVDPSIARTIASETGAQTAVLDPLEGLTDRSAGTNYLEVMRANLATLKKGQSCE